MPKEYLACVDKLISEGKSKKEAQKICAIAYYNRHGITPQEAERRGVKMVSFNKFDYSFDITKIDSERRIIEGYASVEEIDRDNEIIGLEALKNALGEYMKNPIIRYMHNKDFGPIGKAIDAYVDNKGLFIRAKISDKTEKAKEAWGLIEDGILKAFSIGGKVKDFMEVKMPVNGVEKEVRKITEMDLMEVSVVDIPANKGSFFTVVAKSIDGVADTENNFKGADSMAEDVKKEESVNPSEVERKEPEQKEQEPREEVPEEPKESVEGKPEQKEEPKEEVENKEEHEEKSTEADIIKTLTEKVEALEKGLTESMKEMIIKAVQDELEKINLERQTVAPKTEKFVKPSADELKKKSIGELLLDKEAGIF